MSRNDTCRTDRVCPKTGKPITPRRHWWRNPWLLWLYPIVGALSLIWFLVRVLPKPSRATYPCQQVAAPLASSFVVWVAGVLGSALAFRKAGDMMRRSRYVFATLALVVGAAAVYFTAMSSPQLKAEAFALDPIDTVKTPNQPIGTAKGYNPGRVVWVHDPESVDWDGSSGYWWDEGNTDQAAVSQMMADAVCWLTDAPNPAAGWSALFMHFNEQRGLGAIGYQPGDKIAIKLNLTVSNVGSFPNGVDDDGNLLYNLQYNSASKEMIYALLEQLVNEAGVPQADISLGDSTCHFTSREYDYLSATFPNVNYMTGRDGKDLPGRVKTQSSNVQMHWSTSAANGTTPDYLPKYYADAKYFINFAILKAHSAAVTLCGKNHYGSLNRRPADSGYYCLHDSLPYEQPNMYSYRALVDLMGHEHTGGKTLLYLLDGLWGGYSWGGVCPPQKWNMEPFNGDWPSSLFMSQDPVAIDSVGFDFWWHEDIVSWNEFPFTNDVSSREHMPHLSGGTDYLIEGALANNPPSGTFYDPEGDGTRMESQGVYEHWNNRIDKQYSRNLGTGDGIELITGPTVETASVVGRYVFYNNSFFDGNDPAANAADDGAIASDKTPLLPEGTAAAANYTSYSLGLNGVMVDIAGLVATPTAADFFCEAGDGVVWAEVTPAVTVRPGAGADGSDRVSLIFPDQAIMGEWLKVTVKATAATALAADDVFYFGNAPGDTCNSPADAYVNEADIDNCQGNPTNFDLEDFVALKTHFGGTDVDWDDGDYDSSGKVDLNDFIILKTNFGVAATIDDPHDFNRDSRVDAVDQAVCVDHATDATNCLPMLDMAPRGPMTLIEKNSVWKYLDDGSDQGVAWREPAFDDNSWAFGPGQLGYGDGDEATVVSYGPDSSNKYITTYFRHSFSVQGAAHMGSLTVEIVRDDGAIVYLNGSEIVRTSMPTGTVTYDTLANVTAASSSEQIYHVFSGIDPAALVEGENVIAVEIHQSGVGSSDISFDLKLHQPGD